MPRKKGSTKEEAEKLADEAYTLITHGASRMIIHKYFEDKHQIKWRQADNYIKRARMKLADECGMSISEFRNQSVGVYQSIIFSPSTPPAVKVKAQQALDNLLGLPAPKKIAQTDTAGNDLAPLLRRDELDEVTFKALFRLSEVLSAAREKREAEQRAARLGLERPSD